MVEIATNTTELLQCLVVENTFCLSAVFGGVCAVGFWLAFRH